MKYADVGNRNDFSKYALLRVLSAGGLNRVGVCSMLTKVDGSNRSLASGRRGLSQRGREQDAELFDLLQAISDLPASERLLKVRAANPVSGAIYFDDEVPHDESSRFEFMRRARQTLKQADIIFFDPDKGMEQSKPKGVKGSTQYVYLDELSIVYGSGKAFMFYQHYNREDRQSFISERVKRLQGAAPEASIWAFTAAKYMFLVALHPESPSRLHGAATLAAARWPSNFIKGQLVFDPMSGDMAPILVA